MSNWQKTTAFPVGQPDVTLVLEGLMALCQRNDNQYFEFACFGSEIGHQLKVRVDRIEGEREEIGQPQTVPQGTNVSIRVVNNAAKDAPQVYQSVGGDPRDFSHIIDHEANGALPKKKFDFDNLITVKHGLLHTLALTASTFVILDNQNSTLMSERPIAFKIGVDIYLDSEQSVELSFSDNTPAITLIKDGTYQIVKLKNECNVTYNPTSLLAHERNDFYKDYEHIINATETFLKMETQAAPPILPKYVGILALTGEDELSIGDKEAHACHPRGFGFTNNW